MPLDTSIVGASTQPMHHQVDARWLMAYAASLGDMNPAYLDTASNTVQGHPVFPVCPEWPVILDTRHLAAQSSLTAQENTRGVHAAHDLHIFAPIKAGDEITTQATMIGATKIKPGAAYTMRLDTLDKNTQQLLCRTYQLGIYRHVEITGEPQFSEQPPSLPTLADPAAGVSFDLAVGADAAHTYTECARIWNPIHTDKAVAQAAGLPDIILHGTATLALAVSKIVDHFAQGNPSRVTRLGGRFAAMVLMPSTIRLQAIQVGPVVSYQVQNQAGDLAISGGFVCLSD